MANTVDISALKPIIAEAKKVARQYREITGKPLGITGEVGEFIAAELLGLTLTEARKPGYDAIAPDGRRIQIKARCVNKGSRSGRLGSIRLDHPWDTVILVIMDNNFEPIEFHEAKRINIERVLSRPGSKARNERGALGINQFISISSVVWKGE
jgi:hypothetical protein